MSFVSVFRYSASERKYRLCRFVWTRGVVGFGTGYSAQLSIALTPAIFVFRRGWNEWRVIAFGVSVHYQKSYGGRFT